jgi:hypothetical protein
MCPIRFSHPICRASPIIQHPSDVLLFAESRLHKSAFTKRANSRTRPDKLLACPAQGVLPYIVSGRLLSRWYNPIARM